jgi:hypothetical protein
VTIIAEGVRDEGLRIRIHQHGDTRDRRCEVAQQHKSFDFELGLTPDDLIQRLREGKVYVPEQAQRALEHYFSPGNLTALRELALRRTAQRVDEQLLTHMQAHAIRGPWVVRYKIVT